MALLVAALAVTAHKLKNLRAVKVHTAPLPCYTEPGGGEGKAKEGVHVEVKEGTAPTGGQSGHYQELELHGDNRKETV